MFNRSVIEGSWICTYFDITNLKRVSFSTKVHYSTTSTPYVAISSTIKWIEDEPVDEILKMKVPAVIISTNGWNPSQFTDRWTRAIDSLPLTQSILLPNPSSICHNIPYFQRKYILPGSIPIIFILHICKNACGRKYLIKWWLDSVCSAVVC